MKRPARRESHITAAQMIILFILAAIALGTYMWSQGQKELRETSNLSTLTHMADSP